MPRPDTATAATTIDERRRRAARRFIAPMLGVLALAAGWPLARTVWMSFTDAVLAGGHLGTWVGLENYRWLADDPAWWTALGNTAWFTAVSVSLETLLGLAIALVLHAAVRLRGMLRAAVLVPWAIPTVVSAKMWAWMLHDQFGAVNHVLEGVGIIDAPLAWTADPDLAMWAVVMVDVWKTTPFVAILMLAALQMLPRELFEAARVDGIGPVATFTHITLPLIAPALGVAVLFRILDALRVFDVVYVLTADAEATQTVSLYARRQLVDFQDGGFGAAASTAVFFLVAIAGAVALTALRVSRHRPRP